MCSLLNKTYQDLAENFSRTQMCYIKKKRQGSHLESSQLSWLRITHAKVKNKKQSSLNDTGSGKEARGMGLVVEREKGMQRWCRVQVFIGGHHI